MDAERTIATDVLRWQAYRAALAAWADSMDRAPIAIPEQRRSPEDGTPRRVPR
ncbi:hypothetical protein [Actinomycetospora sp. TBRC 11914]|uniref:hypothetical protein n=1 Tax=Actinomycetospora sp. TBRC 11914 TaxID=2729387 RepID=UPI00145E95C3|nr:hypothetical protein [Actinomycetospora sp. TBRC 11914]NMO90715.1 hypothetical protein [Actinomycetospora sp. TBRC 11914]